MSLQDGPVRRCRPVESNAVANPLAYFVHRLIVRTCRDKSTATDLKVLPFSARDSKPFLQLWYDHIAQIFLRAERVKTNPIGHLTGHLQHDGSNRCQRDARKWESHRLRHEVRRHEGKPVVLPLEFERLTVLPAAPNGFESLQVFTHARCRSGPRHTETLFVVRTNLRPKPHDEATSRCFVQIPCQIGARHRATSK